MTTTEQKPSPQKTNKSNKEKSKVSVRDKTKAPHKKALSPLLLTSILSSIVALGFGFYNANQVVVLQESQQKAQANFDNSQVQLTRAFETKFTNQQAQMNQIINDNSRRQQQEIALLTKSVFKLNKNQRGDNQSWKLERAAYLLNMAQLTLDWEKSPTSAIELLHAADNLIKTINNPILIGLRHSLSNEINALQAVPVIQTDNLLEKLNSINISELPLKKPAANSLPQAKQNSPKNLSAWQTALEQSKQALSKIVIIRKHTKDYQTLLSKQDEVLIYQQLQLNLKQAQWALMHQKDNIYQFSLNEVAKTIQTYFDDKSDKTKAALTSINELKNIKIFFKFPSINQSYQQLMEIIKSHSEPKNGAKI